MAVSYLYSKSQVVLDAIQCQSAGEELQLLAALYIRRCTVMRVVACPRWGYPLKCGGHFATWGCPADGYPMEPDLLSILSE